MMLAEPTVGWAAALAAFVVSCASIHSIHGAPRPGERWKIAEPVRRPVTSCAAIEPSVERREAGTLTLRVRMEGGAQRPCRVGITQATLRLGAGIINADPLPAPPALTSLHTVFTRLHFAVEPTLATQATLILAMTVDGEPAPELSWPITIEKTIPGGP